MHHNWLLTRGATVTDNTNKWLKRPAALDSVESLEKPADQHGKEAEDKPQHHRENYFLWIHVHGSLGEVWLHFRGAHPPCGDGGPIDSSSVDQRRVPSHRSISWQR